MWPRLLGYWYQRLEKIDRRTPRPWEIGRGSCKRNSISQRITGQDHWKYLINARSDLMTRNSSTALRRHAEVEVQNNEMESKNKLTRATLVWAWALVFFPAFLWQKCYKSSDTTHFNVRSLEGTMGLVILGYKLAAITYLRYVGWLAGRFTATRRSSPPPQQSITSRWPESPTLRIEKRRS